MHLSKFYFEEQAVESLRRAERSSRSHINLQEARALTRAIGQQCLQAVEGRPGGRRRRDRRRRGSDPLVATAQRQLYSEDL